MRSLFRLASAFVLLAMLPPTVALAAKGRTFKNVNGDEIKVYDRTGTRMLRVSFMSGGGRNDRGFEQALQDALKAIAEIARDQSSDVFAVTNMYCSGPMIFKTNMVNGCAIEGAWLKVGEKIETRPKDNVPVYFSTDAAVAGRAPTSWVASFHTRDGLTGKVNIVSSAGVPPAPILGAASSPN